MKQKLTARGSGRRRQGGELAGRGGRARSRCAAEHPRSWRRRHVPVIPMTVEEAALQLDGSKEDFIVFREADSDRVSVLYRRRDRTYGLVTPDF